MSGTPDRTSGRATRNLLEGTATLVIGLVLWLSTEGVKVPGVTLTKVGVVMMCVGGGYRSPPGTHSTSPTSLFAVLARMNRRSESRLR